MHVGHVAAGSAVFTIFLNFSMLHFHCAFRRVFPVLVSMVSMRSIGGHVRAGTALGHYYTSTSNEGSGGGEAGAAAWVVWQPGGRHVKL